MLEPILRVTSFAFSVVVEMITLGIWTYHKYSTHTHTHTYTGITLAMVPIRIKIFVNILVGLD